MFSNFFYLFFFFFLTEKHATLEWTWANSQNFSQYSDSLAKWLIKIHLLTYWLSVISSHKQTNKHVRKLCQTLKGTVSWTIINQNTWEGQTVYQTLPDCIAVYQGYRPSPDCQGASISSSVLLHVCNNCKVSAQDLS